MLQQMRSLAKYVWLFVALAFVGGFLLYETSGLVGRTPVTNTTAVAVVNGQSIMYRDFEATVQQRIQAQQQQAGTTLSQDDTRRIENSVFDEMVSNVLLDQEYRRRGITVSDDEIREFARYEPPDFIQTNADFQTDGKFNPAKYQAFLASPEARQSGELLQLEGYYRSDIPRRKLFDQIASGVYVPDAELWRAWRDQHDSAQVSYIAFTPNVTPADAKAVSDADARSYFDQHKAEFQRPGRAVLSVAIIPRAVTAADTAAARAHVLALREEITKGAKFEDVAKRESADSGSAAKGGDVGKFPKGMMVSQFYDAAAALKPGELSQPVLSPFGFHLIRLDSKKGDTLSAHHILIRITASDTAAARIDKEADRLSRSAANSEQGSKLDASAKELNLKVQTVQAVEDQPAMLNGQNIPSVSAWAFGGAKPGETSDLYDDDNGYYLARLDSLTTGGEARFEDVRADIQVKLATERAVDKLLPEAQKVASTAATGTLDAAAQSDGKKVVQTGLFSRGGVVPGLGQYSEAIGASFALPVGAVSAPVKTDAGIYVIRIDKRIVADSSAWVAQKAAQKTLREQQAREQAVSVYLSDLRKSAKIDDRRKQINSAVRRQES